ncbi:MAG TPA: metallophosphoesterase, partial [Polyangiaceae bacterium]|nr:metallophosphoesterase [Polyangiaceae bacterium]
MKPNAPVRIGQQLLERRELLKLLSFGGVVSAAGLFGCASAASQKLPANPAAPTPNEGPPARSLPAAPEDFVFLQLSDTHWGYRGDANPEAASTLRRAVDAINASSLEPDFVVFTGDLTHTTDDSSVRRARMKEFRAIVDGLKVKTRYFIPGEHDASPDGGEAYRDAFGETHASFDHKGVHFTLLD